MIPLSLVLFFPVADGGNGVGAGKEGRGGPPQQHGKDGFLVPLILLWSTRFFLLLLLVLVFRRGGASQGDIVPYMPRGKKKGQNILPKNWATFALLPIFY